MPEECYSYKRRACTNHFPQCCSFSFTQCRNRPALDDKELAPLNSKLNIYWKAVMVLDLDNQLCQLNDFIIREYFGIAINNFSPLIPPSLFSEQSFLLRGDIFLNDCPVPFIDDVGIRGDLPGHDRFSKSIPCFDNELIIILRHRMD